MAATSDNQRDSGIAARVALDLGLVAPEDLEKALEAKHLAEEAGGLKLDLADVLVSKKLIDREQARRLNESIAIHTGAARIIGEYEVLEKLGQGGMGAVYKARHLKTDNVVALKILPPSMAGDKLIARFTHEAEIAKKLKDPHIVGWMDFGFDGDRGCYYCALEYVEGLDLAKLMDERGRLSEQQLVKIGSQIASALGYAWRQGMVHRDVKPANIMVTADGTAKLLDLGLARSTEGESPKLTRSGSFIGTTLYASPEQAKGLKDIDVRSDIYSLGVTLFHAATGYPPFDGETDLEVLRMHSEDDPPWASDVAAEVSEAFSYVLMKTMAKSPKERYPSPAGLLADLAALQLGKHEEVVERLRGEVVRPASSSGGAADLKKRDGALAARRGRRRKRGTATFATRHAARGYPARKKPAGVIVAISAVLLMSLAGLLIFGAGSKPARRDRDLPSRASPTPIPTGEALPGTDGSSDAGWASDPSEAPADELPAQDGDRNLPVEVEAPSEGDVAESVARAAFEEARRYEHAHPNETDQAVARYREVVAAHDGTRAAGEARIRIAVLRTPKNVAAGPASGPGADAGGVAVFAGHRYKLITTARSWVKARDYCRTLGGHLVTIQSTEENKFVANLAGGRRIWIGLYEESPGVWKWVNSEPVNFMRWRRGEPGGSGRRNNRVTLRPGNKPRWGDQPGSREAPFVCEWDSVAGPAPAVAAASVPATVKTSFVLKGELEVLDLSANNGINPATGMKWKDGDRYRFAFVSSTTTSAESRELGTYDAFVQRLARTAGLGGTWKVLGSSQAVDARDHTSTNPDRNGPGVAIFLLDGTTSVARSSIDLWDGKLGAAINRDERGKATSTSIVYTGTDPRGRKRYRPLGGSVEAEPRASVGKAAAADGSWMLTHHESPGKKLPVYALSNPLTVRRIEVAEE